MPSDDEDRSKRRHRDPRMKKSKRSSKPDATRPSSSRQDSEERVSSSGQEGHERSSRRKKSSSRRSRTSHREEREEEAEQVGLPNPREENIFTRGIPAPPLAAAELNRTHRNEEIPEGFEDDQDADENGEEHDSVEAQDMYNGHQVLLEEDENEEDYNSKGEEVDGGETDHIPHGALDEDISPSGRAASAVHEALETCQWEDLYDLSAELEGEELKRLFEMPSKELQSTVFQTIVWKAPAALTLFLLELRSNELSVLCMARDADGNTALHLFCANVDSFEKRELVLLKHLVQGAPRSLQLPNSEGDTPLHLLVASKACSSGETSSEATAARAVSILLDESVDAAIIQDASGATPLHVAISHGSYELVLMKLLEVAPVASKVADERGMLPLHYVAAFWQTPFGPVDLLVRANPEALTATTVNGDTPLHLLISNNPGDVERLDSSMMKIVELLAGMSGDDRGETSTPGPIMMPNDEKLTPVHCCALFDAPHQITRAIMRHPLAKSASLLTNMFGATALHMAVSQQRVADSISNVVEIGTTEAAAAEDRLKRSPLHVAAQNVHSTGQLIQVLCELYPEATAMRTQRGHLPLHLAAQSQAKVPVVKALLRVDSKAAEVRNKSSNTPLHDAAKYRASEGVVQLLLETYPDAVYVQNQYGNLPLHCATAYQAPPEVIQLLLEAWPDGAAMQNRNQDAPLHYAAAYTTSVDAVKPLIDAAPAAVLLLNSSGQSPIDRAEANNAPDEIINLLEASAEEWTKKASQDGWGAFSPDDEGSGF